MLVKTHLIVKDQWDDFEVNWIQRLKDTNPKLNENGLPTFIIISNSGRLEMSTIDINSVEKQAKKFAYPRGRGSLTIDKSYIYIKEEKEEVLLGVVTKNHHRKYAPMYDDIP